MTILNLISIRWCNKSSGICLRCTSSMIPRQRCTKPSEIWQMHRCRCRHRPSQRCGNFLILTLENDQEQAQTPTLHQKLYQAYIQILIEDQKQRRGRWNGRRERSWNRWRPLVSHLKRSSSTNSLWPDSLRKGKVYIHRPETRSSATSEPLKGPTLVELLPRCWKTWVIVNWFLDCPGSSSKTKQIKRPEDCRKDKHLSDHIRFGQISRSWTGSKSWKRREKE